MNVHKNARLTPRGRERIVRQVESWQAPKCSSAERPKVPMAEKVTDATIGLVTNATTAGRSG